MPLFSNVKNFSKNIAKKLGPFYGQINSKKSSFSSLLGSQLKPLVDNNKKVPDLRVMSTLQSPFRQENKSGKINPNYVGLGILGVGALAYLMQKMYFSNKQANAEDRALIKLVLNTIKEEFPHMLPKNFSEEAWWKQLEHDGYIERNGDDKIWRPVFVSLQAATESALLSLHQKGQLNFVLHTTHTDLPPSPLCEIKEKDMHPKIATDPVRRDTVYSRITVMANVLKSGILVFVIYSKDGLQKRTFEAQKRYKENVEKYLNLNDCPLAKTIEPKDSGATVFFQSKTFSSGFFSISSLQATTEGGIWKASLDSTTDPKSEKTKQLLQQRESFFNENGLPDLGKYCQVKS